MLPQLCWALARAPPEGSPPSCAVPSCAAHRGPGPRGGLPCGAGVRACGRPPPTRHRCSGVTRTAPPHVPVTPSPDPRGSPAPAPFHHVSLGLSVLRAPLPTCRRRCVSVRVTEFLPDLLPFLPQASSLARPGGRGFHLVLRPGPKDSGCTSALVPVGAETVSYR